MAALEGITVVSLEHAIAAPLASRHLADQGARVIKVERPDGGDFARHYDRRARGEASHFIWVNRSKESLCLDLKSEQGKDTLRQLIERADVFLQNLGPGVCASPGFSEEVIHALNSSCITCSISGYGNGGPFERRKAYDLLIQAESGLLGVTGSAGEVCKAGVSIADIAAGMYAYSTILTALIERQSTGKGRHIDVSMLDALVEWMGYPLYYALDGQARATLQPLIVDTLAQLTLAKLIERLDAARIAFSQTRSLDDVWRHPQLLARERLVEVDTPACPMPAMLPPWATEGTARMDLVTALGEHTDAILAWLATDPAQGHSH